MLAWSILIILVAVGMKESVRPAQANIRIAGSTTQVTLVSITSAAAASVTAARPAARYVVQRGDTLSGIAARLAVRGGWPATRPTGGYRPGSGCHLAWHHSGAAWAGGAARYTVVAGDTLAGIAAALAVPAAGGLYAANRRVIGPDPNVIRPGTVLTVSRPVRSSHPAPGPGRLYPAPPSAPPGSGHGPLPGRTGAPAAAGMPQWLKTVLLAAGLVVGAAFLAEPVLAVRRRRRRAVQAARPGRASAEARPDSGRLAAEKARIVLADYDRVVVTRCVGDGTVYVLRPPGEAPEAILRAARLVLPEDPYEELASQLGMPPSWPIVLADYDRVVVTHCPSDGTVYVLRPPGEAPEAILRAARLVLPEDPYEELADQLGVPADLPMK